ncbi:deoxyribodipyrimidine photo-lyase [Pilimelia columellifera]|uniref:Deoxyribodipyrimidine photo-lyase n=1 Tax=Pilimelia columellifera subsp. columellifera TaxID=706583 RepID=A0ABN3NEF2_9ACTN
MADPAVLLLTRDLRVHDNPALVEAARGGRAVAPLFVVDPAITVSEPRRRFLAESLADLQTSLRRLGADLVMRVGDPVVEAVRLAGQLDARTILCAEDVSRYARNRQRRLARACERERIDLWWGPGPTVVPAGEALPAGGGDHYKIFTPYHRAWSGRRWRAVAERPEVLRLPSGLDGDDPLRFFDDPSGRPAAVAAGGESEGRRRVRRWRGHAAGYGDGHDDMAGDRTSRLSPYLHFGCVSAREVVAEFAGNEAFVRQMCWRDFYHQLLAAFPDLATRVYRATAADDWADDPQALDAWRQGRTGVPIVDAGMRQLAAEGWMHNRARLITAGFLVKKLGLDWRAGLAWFGERLLDADVANNAGNWQWVAGTGTDARPHRGFNPIRQARRYDPDGDFVRQHVPELAHIEGPAVHEPWLLPRRPSGYRISPVDGGSAVEDVFEGR